MNAADLLLVGGAVGAAGWFAWRALVGRRRKSGGCHSGGGDGAVSSCAGCQATLHRKTPGAEAGRGTR